MSTSTLRRVAALASLALITPLGVGIALADDVTNNLDNTIDANVEVVSTTVGAPATTVQFRIEHTSNFDPTFVDSKNGCNLTGQTTLVVNVVSSNPSVATLSASQFTFGNCNDVRSLVVTPTATGSTQISLTQFFNNTTGSFNLASATFRVDVAASNTAPVVTIQAPASGANIEGNTSGGANVTVQATATDAQDASPPAVSCTPPSGLFAVGSHTVTCSATDSGGLSGSASVSFSVVDTIAPTVNAPDDTTAEATAANGAAVNYSGATATDIVDGSITPTCAPASGSIFALGANTVTCSATDSAGNTGSDDFTITVVDTTAPTVNAPDDTTAEATSAAGATVNYSGATATDAVDGPITPDCTPASGSIFALGANTVTCSATDSAGNTGSDDFTITVVDTTAPTVNVPADITEEATSAAGATVTYTGATATDIVDGPRPVTCNPASGSTFGLGPNTVTCSATDNTGNTGSDSFTITVVDTTAPTVYVPTDITAVATSAAGAVINYTATATDIVDGSRPVNCAPASGSTFAPGTTTVSCTASDTTGNTSLAKTFKVTVAFDFIGFLQPVDNKVLNGMKAGSTAPIKWRVTDGNGGYISSLSIIKTVSSGVMSCSSITVEDTLEEYATGGTQLRYDLTADQFIYNWQSPKKAGACYKVRIVLTDGGVYEAMFRLR